MTPRSGEFTEKLEHRDRHLKLREARMLGCDAPPPRGRFHRLEGLSILIL